METSRVQETTTNKNVPLTKLLVEDLHSEWRWRFEKSFLNESKMLIRRKQHNGGEQKRGLESDKKAEEDNLDSFEKKSIRNPIIGSQLTSRLRKKRNQNGILCQATDSESDISLQLYPWIKDGGNTVNILSW